MNKLNDLALLPEKERYGQLIFNLTGEKKDKVGYKQVNIILKKIS